ncbi:Uncharacterised protein [Streptococcus pneumoniae]|nr:Uncharacterised protein [Streptococcus pneumoniae]VQV04880.1 Uncharacterised protein [Streptococcus pneumoniae]VSP18124.1 Uncharacterised protein [Streptococcus pneumoniae]VSQ06798.1 Uncharacterised protein [Streptococcus pneumoniae]
MSVLDEEYLKNTRKVYNDFCNQADNYRTSKDFIDNIPIECLARYREIILAEHDSCIKNDEAVRNFVTSVLLSAFVSALVSAMISLEIQTYKFVIPFIIGMIWTVVVFLMINWNYIGKY